jgi:DNA-binding protein HU-beta
MNKADLIAVAEGFTTTKKAAAKAINAVFGAIEKALKRGDSVTIIGFGTFSVAKRAARTGRNPQTGAEIKNQSQEGSQVLCGQGAEGCREISTELRRQTDGDRVENPGLLFCMICFSVFTLPCRGTVPC